MRKVLYVWSSPCATGMLLQQWSAIEAGHCWGKLFICMCQDSNCVIIGLSSRIWVQYRETKCSSIKSVLLHSISFQFNGMKSYFRLNCWFRVLDQPLHHEYVSANIWCKQFNQWCSCQYLQFLWLCTKCKRFVCLQLSQWFTSCCRQH